MSMRTPDGLIHIVETHEELNYKGVLACGLPYRKTDSRRDKWIRLEMPANERKREVRVTRTMKQPTCLWCITGMKR